VKAGGNIGWYILALIGGIWALQGLYLLGMARQLRRLIIGIVIAMNGVALLFWTNRQACGLGSVDQCDSFRLTEAPHVEAIWPEE
jgi:hypothetical protein